MDVLKYTGPTPLLSDGRPDHKPSIWYISDKDRYDDTIFAIDQPGGFAPYDYAFTGKGKALYKYFSIARYDFRDVDYFKIQIGDAFAKFSRSTLRDVMLPELKRLFEDFRMLYCDYVANVDVNDDTIHTLIFPTNRGFFHIRDGRLEIVGCYYGIDRSVSDGSYSILMNGEVHSGPFAADDMSGYDWLENSIYRNIGEWRRTYGRR